MTARGSVPTNEHIVRLLEAVPADLAEAKKRQDEIARTLERLLTDVAKRAGVGLFRRFEIMRHWQTASGAAAVPAPAIGPDGLHMTDRSYACLAANLAEAVAANWQRYEREARRARAARIAGLAPSADPVGGSDDP